MQGAYFRGPVVTAILVTIGVATPFAYVWQRRLLGNLDLDIAFFLAWPLFATAACFRPSTPGFLVTFFLLLVVGYAICGVTALAVFK